MTYTNISILSGIKLYPLYINVNELNLNKVSNDQILF